ncbi:MAG TPA: alternative ribosome rescue aminoacyl-tRNA hydrolase ArfB [Intrasporangium sp.]|nr:alternative ribosome rescue aminoacyl-tRNA hydrolase ArfB [Intrasporangium sp.]
MVKAPHGFAGLVVSSSVVVPEAELEERFSRSSGPGGQGVNTADSRVELTFDLAGSSSIPEPMRGRMLKRLNGRLVDGRITVSASEHRTQLANRRAARERLAEILQEAATPPPAKRRATRPTRGSQERRLQAKRSRSEVKRGRGRFTE